MMLAPYLPQEEQAATTKQRESPFFSFGTILAESRQGARADHTPQFVTRADEVIE